LGIGGGAGHVAAGVVTGLGGKCIYEEADVRMADGSKRRVKHLEIGDRVLAYSVEKGLHSSRVYAEFYNDNQTLVKIVEIETSNGRKIPVTPQHSLFVRQCLADDQKSWATKSASQIRVGDCLPRYYTEGDVVEESVVNIRVFEARGIRQPVTETGTIIVDDVVISCYDRVVSQEATHLALFPYQWLVGVTQTYRAQLKSLIPSLLNVIGFDSALF